MAKAAVRSKAMVLVLLTCYSLLIPLLESVIVFCFFNINILRNEFDFWKVRGIMTISGVLQSK